MLSERDFSKLSSSLAVGFELDGIVGTLAHIMTAHLIRPEDSSRLRAAKGLLEQIRRGERWLDSGKFDRHSAQAALAFDRAASVLAMPSPTPADFDRAMSKLEKTINILLAGRLPSDEETQEARLFYGRLARRVLQESHRVASVPTHGERPTVATWTQAPSGGTT